MNIESLGVGGGWVGVEGEREQRSKTREQWNNNKKKIELYFYTPKHSAARSIEAVGLRLGKEAPKTIQQQAAGCKIPKHHTARG